MTRRPVPRARAASHLTSTCGLTSAAGAERRDRFGANDILARRRSPLVGPRP
ncbi:MAG: cation-transporting P-type ATPase [Candidatus Rokuibacteriota bacterium]